MALLLQRPPPMAMMNSPLSSSLSSSSNTYSVNGPTTPSFKLGLGNCRHFNPLFLTKKKKKKQTLSRYSICRSSWQELAGVVIFSAIPFTAVKAIANSPLGETLQRRMLETKKASVLNSSKFKALADKARKESFWYGEERPRWLGPIQFDYPDYLSGELPGDYGFDVAGLSKDPVAFQKYFNFEILHARWAMLAALGALVPELLNLSGVIHFIEPIWWKVGYAKLQGDTLDYLGIPGLHIAGGQGVVVIAICQALLMRDRDLNLKIYERSSDGRRCFVPVHPMVITSHGVFSLGVLLSYII